MQEKYVLRLHDVKCRLQFFCGILALINTTQTLEALLPDYAGGCFVLEVKD
jgi:hypothetical protein